MIAVSILLKSWAMPLVSWVIASIFCICLSWVSSSSLSFSGCYNSLIIHAILFREVVREKIIICLPSNLFRPDLKIPGILLITGDICRTGIFKKYLLRQVFKQG